MTHAPRKSQKPIARHAPRNLGSCPKCMSETREKTHDEYRFPGNGWTCTNRSCYYGQPTPPSEEYDWDTIHLGY